MRRMHLYKILTTALFLVFLLASYVPGYTVTLKATPAIKQEIFLPSIGAPFKAGPTLVAIAAGEYHTCALTSGGGVKCWGDNQYGQLGDGTTTDRHFPVDVVGLGSGVKAIAAGGINSCALTTSGGLKCWGANDSGQLGNGIHGGAPLYGATPVPVDVIGLTSGVKAIGVGFAYACAVTTSGAAKCWGRNSSGQLGTGTMEEMQLTPIAVTGLSSGVRTIALGNDHTCALTTVGGLKCWGRNYRGQLGDGTGGEYEDRQLTPVDVVGLSSDVRAIDLGGHHTCALTTAGAVKCWGLNDQGQLGDGIGGQEEDDHQLVPTDVVGLSSGVAAISLASLYSCAITAGEVKCWGNYRFGPTRGVNTPVEKEGLPPGIQAITSGTGHVCVLTEIGNAKCWGSNNADQLGNGEGGTGSPIHNMPVDVVWP